MPIVPDVIERISSMPLYDTYTAAAGATVPTQVKLFTDPQSGSKGLNRTNLNKPQQLEAPKAFLVHAIRVMFGADMLFADVNSIMENYILRFFIGDAEYATAGLEFFPAGAGLYGSDTAKFCNGLPDPRAINAFEHPIPIGQGESFRIELHGTSFDLTAAASSGTGAFVRVYLDGVMERGK